MSFQYMKAFPQSLMKSEFLQIALLTLLVGGTGFTFFRIWTGEISQRQSSTPSLPKQIDLNSWQFIGSRSLPFPPKEAVKGLTNILNSGRLYQYRRSGMPLTVELWTVENTNGDVQSYIDAYAQQKIPPGRQDFYIRYRRGIGFYGIILSEGYIYLSSCINLTGESTFSISQFTQARFQRDLTFPQLSNWILGKKPIFNKQCLWSHLRMPKTSQNLKNTSILEATWFNLYQEWRLNNSSLGKSAIHL